MTKTIRIWDGCKVVQLITVNQVGGSTSQVAGGAENSSRVDIELDPFAGLIVDHSAPNSPIYFREAQE